MISNFFRKINMIFILFFAKTMPSFFSSIDKVDLITIEKIIKENTISQCLEDQPKLDPCIIWNRPLKNRRYELPILNINHIHYTYRSIVVYSKRGILISGNF